MRVVHLTSVHPRYDTRIFLKECRSLAAAGHDVTLVVADGKGSEQKDGVCILDVGRPGSRLARMWNTVNAIYRQAMQLDADVYHFHDPELLRIAGKLRQLGQKTSVIFDAHEDVPRQILAKQWIPLPLRRLVSVVIEWFESCVARKLHGVVTATPHIAERFLKLNVHTVDINNYPMPDELVPVASVHDRKRQICYVGGITRVRGLESLIHALPLLPDVVLVLGGSFSEPEFEAAMRALPGWNQVDYRGYMNRDAVRQTLHESVAGMVTLLPTPAYLDALPVKMFEYMSAELPVIASDFPLWKTILENAQAGICVNPEDPRAIAGAIRRLLDDPALVERMGLSGRQAVLEHYNWPREESKLLRFYQGF